MSLYDKRHTNDALKGVRPRRVAEQIQRVLSSALATGRLSLPELATPEFSSIMVMVSHVVASPDLKHAKVFLSFLLSDNAQGGSGTLDASIKNRLIKLCQQYARSFQHVIAQDLNLRFTPQLLFFEDDFQAQSDRTEELFRNPKVQQDITEKN